jgi:hypothetical protein
MSLEIVGKMFKLLPEQSGTSTRGDWKKREFVIETKEQFPKKVCISCWNERVDDLKNIAVGQDLKVSINLESREYNEKWYTDARAWKIETGSGSNEPSGDENDGEDFGNKVAETGNDEFQDDLPF